MMRSIDVFTPEALLRWNKIPKWAQEKILDNGFCRNCLDSVTIVLESAKMKDKDLVLRGKCQNCQTDVCRVVEPENE